MNDIFIYLLPFPPSERALRFRDIMATAQQKMSVAEKLENAVQFKEKGNASYKDGDYKAAAMSYHKAILYLKVRARTSPGLLNFQRFYYELYCRESTLTCTEPLPSFR